MEDHLKLFMPLSLKELLLRKVAALFCSNSDILKPLYRTLYSRLPTCEMKKWLKATEEKILILGLPESLNKQVVDRIQAIGFEIKKWKIGNKHVRFSSELEMELPDISKLCGPSTGTIDYRKISEQYVLCDWLIDWQRYEIACLNCLKNHIPHLWQKLSEEEKREYEVYRWVPSLVCWWPYILEGKQSNLDYLWRESGQNLASFNQWIFEESAKRGNQVAAEFFFQKLTPEEREVSLMRTAHKVNDVNVLFFLLSLMTPEQQIETVKDRPASVLLCFLDWPRRHLFPENAALIWTFIQESDYDDVLRKICFSYEYENFFPKFFHEFFKNAPLNFIKKSFVGQSKLCPPACRLLGALIENEDSESIEVMLRYADAASRVKLVSCDAVFNRFYFCILSKRWDGVVACLRNAALSEEDRGTVKESFMQNLDQRVSGAQEEQRFRRFFEFLHETDAGDDKERKVKRLKLQ